MVGFSTIHAVEAGTVLAVGFRPGWEAGGYQILIQHAGYTSRYLHMVSGSARVIEGSTVSAGTPIGTMGSTGAYDVHLHLEINTGAGQIDPVPFLTNRIANGPGTAGIVANYPPTAIIDSADRISLYAIKSDGNLYGASQSAAGGGLSSWALLGGSYGALTGRPAVLRLASGLIAIYARTTQGTVVGINQTVVGGSFTSWTAIGTAGNGIVGDPAAVQFPNGVIGVYATTNAGTVSGVAQTIASGPFGSWTQIGSTSVALLGTPAIAKYSDGRLRLFARTATTEIFTSAQSAPGAGFSTWSATGTGGAGISTDPTLINDGGRVTVFAGAGSTVSSVTQASASSAFGTWVNLGSGPVGIGVATPTALKTGSTYSVYTLGDNGTAWGTTVNTTPAPANWAQIGSGATLATALASIRTSTGLNAVYAASTSGVVVGSGQSTPGGGFSTWAAM